MGRRNSFVGLRETRGADRSAQPSTPLDASTQRRVLAPLQASAPLASEPNGGAVARVWQGEKHTGSNEAGGCCGDRSNTNTSARCRRGLSLS